MCFFICCMVLHGPSGLQLNQAIGGRGLYEVSAHTENASLVTEPQTSCCKRALNTTAAFNQQRPARTAAWALNDGQRGNEVTPWYVIFSFLNTY